MAHWLGKKTKAELIKLVWELHVNNLNMTRVMKNFVLEEEE